MEKILRGKAVAKNINSELKDLITLGSLRPKLVVILIGEDPASEYYVKSIQKKGKKLGIEVNLQKYDDQFSQKELKKIIKKLNLDQNVHGIMLQKPLPAHINDDEVAEMISPEKDVDAFHPLNIGNMILGKGSFVPCTAQAVIEILKHYEIETEGKNIVVLGRSDVIGKPVANLLLRKTKYGNATVTVCHSRTKDISAITKSADILVAAIGKPYFVKKNMLKDGCIVIDVGVNKIEHPEKGEIYVGDVCYEDAYEIASAITPVPGGVGIVTTAVLLKHVVFSAKKKNNVEMLAK